MKNIIITFAIIVITLVLIISVSLVENNKNITQIKNHNKQYEQYFEKEVYGVDVTTLINKATSENIKNEVEKDEKGYFIENDTNSIKIEINLLYEEELTAYPMEALSKVGIEGFVRNFNLIKFKCTSLQYHENTKRVKKIVFEQIEE